MNIPTAVQPFWDAFRVTLDTDPTARFYESFYFADNETSANKLAQLVLAGTKRATAGLLWSFEDEGEAPPVPGALSVVTNWHGEPLCVIEIRSVVVLPFEEISEEMAAIEGEGDGSLRYWREGHWAFFGRECGRLGRVPDMSMPVVFEQFEVVFRSGWKGTCSTIRQDASLAQCTRSHQ